MANLKPTYQAEPHGSGRPICANCPNCSHPPATGTASKPPSRTAPTPFTSAWTSSTRGCGRDNFTEADLPRLMEFLHRRGVKGYVTLNTLVFENELAEAEQYLRTMIAAGVDAVIVQDVGICRLIRRLSPDFPIHASTQMTITSAAGVEFARELGCQPRGARPRMFDQGNRSRSTSRFALRASHFRWRFSSTAHSAWLIPASVSPARRWADAPPIAANARRRAGCLTN